MIKISILPFLFFTITLCTNMHGFSVLYSPITDDPMSIYRVDFQDNQQIYALIQKMITGNDTLEHFDEIEELLQTAQENLFQELKEKFHISYESFLKEQKEFSQSVDAYRDSMIDKDQRVCHAISNEILELIYDVAQDCEIDPDMLIIALHIKPYTPAYVSDPILYVNPELLTKHKEAAQRFILGHEFCHYIHRDTSTLEIIANLMAPDGNTTQEHEDFLKEMQRFFEVRADLFGLTIDSIYQEGAIAFHQQHLKLFGECAGISHPKSAHRLQLAQMWNSNQII